MEKSDNTSELHVHFDQSVIKEAETEHSVVTYEKQGDNIIVNLGFLKVFHRYLIDLKIPAEHYEPKEPVTLVDAGTTSNNNHCKLIQFDGEKTACGNFYYVKIEFFAYKEKFIRELVDLVCSKHKQLMFKLVLIAQVMGRNQGTPMLKKGIHCMGEEDCPNNEMNENSDTDWAGFSGSEDKLKKGS